MLKQGHQKKWDMGCYILIIISLIIKFIFISHRDVSYDEPYSLFRVQMTLSELWNEIISSNQSLLYETLLHFWVKLGPLEPEWTRIPSVIFSGAMLYVYYLLAKKLFDPRVAWFATAFIAFSSFFTFFAHDTRVYALFNLLFIWSMYTFFNWLETDGKFRNKHSILLIALNTLLLYSHYFGIFIFFVQGLIVLLIKPYRKQIVPFILISLVPAILFSPYVFRVVTEIQNAAQGGFWVEKPGINSLYFNLWKVSNSRLGAVTFLIMFGLSVFYFFLNKKFNYNRNAFLCLLIWSILPYISVFLVSQSVPVFLDRYVSFCFPPYILAIFVSIFSLTRYQRIIPYIIASSIIILMMATYKPNHNRWPISDLMDRLKEHEIKNRAIFIIDGAERQAFTYHYDQDLFGKYNNFDDNLAAVNIYPVKGDFPEQIGNFEQLIIWQGGKKFGPDDLNTFLTRHPDYELSKKFTHISPYRDLYILRKRTK